MKRMFDAGHGRSVIDDYLQRGGLIRIVNDTHKWYLALLTAITGYVNVMGPQERWEGSIAALVLKHHHLEKLALIRQTAASYRELVL